MIDFNQPPPVHPVSASKTVADDVRRRDLRGVALSGLLAAMNHLLTQQQWARERLAAHAGKAVRIGVDAGFPFAMLAPNLHARVGPQGLLEPTESAQADVSLWIKPSVDALFAGLRGGPTGLSGHLRVEGDVLLAGLLGELAQHLRWDPEEDLSRVVGDAGAYRLAESARKASGQIDDTRQRLENTTSQFFTVEQPYLVDRSSFEAFRAEVGELLTRLDALESRLHARR